MCDVSDIYRDKVTYKLSHHETDIERKAFFWLCRKQTTESSVPKCSEMVEAKYLF